MNIRLAICALPLALTQVVVANQPSPGSGDRDVSAEVFVGAAGAGTALSEAARESGEPARNPSTHIQGGEDQPSPAQTKTASSPGVPPSKGVSATELLPPASPAAMAATTDVCSPDFSFADMPLSEAVRVVSRYLDRPIQVSVDQEYRINGTWSNTAPLVVLQRIVDRYGLQLRIEPRAYVIEEHARPIEVAQMSATAPVATAPTYRALPDSLFADKTIQAVPAMTGKERKKVEAALANKEAHLQKQRAALQAASR